MSYTDGDAVFAAGLLLICVGMVWLGWLLREKP
jgi:hypothetical protein